ncbi:DUF2577 family protein [Clostridiaceae bacterium M8S5]|nr:DUF2577 family protein [Clostridiaceae bacterium M8S5]
MQGINELAKLFKERDNNPYIGPLIGVVVEPLPDIQIALGEKILLTKENLVVDLMFKEHERSFEISGDIKLTQDEPCETEEGTFTEKTTNPNAPTPHPHHHKVPEITLDTQYEGKGVIKFSDMKLEKEDLVLLVPSSDEQTYYLIDKVKQL